MGKSTADNSTKTTTSYTTSESVNVGLTGTDVSSILAAFSNFGLQSEQIAYSNAHPENAQSANLQTYIPWIIGGILGVLGIALLLR